MLLISQLIFTELNVKNLSSKCTCSELLSIIVLILYMVIICWVFICRIIVSLLLYKLLSNREMMFWTFLFAGYVRKCGVTGFKFVCSWPKAKKKKKKWCRLGKMFLWDVLGSWQLTLMESPNTELYFNRAPLTNQIS